MDKLLEELNLGLQTSFIDSNVNSLLSFRSEFIANDYKKGKKLLVSLEEELQYCESFCMSVAFITKSGITPLLQTLKELEERNVSGKILTTDYLLFTEPAALNKLASLKNIELKMYLTNDNKEGFHTKGYIFQKGEIYRMIIGSSNMTLNAITINREWNTKIVSNCNGEIAQDILGEFNNLWNDHQAKAYEDVILDYTQRYDIKKAKNHRLNNMLALQGQPKLEALTPNKMQQEFIKNIKQMIAEKNIDRAMLISATGTGKTFASAFALKELQPKKSLFIVHREQIAKQALESYRRVFGDQKTYVLFSGNSNDILVTKHADFVFATMQMISKNEVINNFSPYHFTNIILDECHHAGAESYKKIMNYFKPKFWLGMTASPDTTRFNVYEIFNHNIAYEIRLQQALEEDLLCPFHYFGITDIEIADDFSNNEISFNDLASDSRVDYIIEQANYYGHSGDRVKGLIFCSRKEEAYELSAKFNARGYCTAVLTGEDSEQQREATIDRLTKEVPKESTVKTSGALDYIFSIDIFSEGIDIPQVNQIIMLRPTKSPVVFVQQLGRGLRKYENKEYVVILDFIGNYNNNFMIPIALSGDRSYNKDSIRRYMLEGTRTIPGASTIHFDEISKKRIFTAIDRANFTELRLIRENYQKLKNKLGRIPKLLDFDLYGEMDVFCIINNHNLGSYYKFLRKSQSNF
ncbi:MAG: DEAD/DEAH box helicase family protein [Erysipelotrichaceae bacterium]|nr:DEAD/DEAH box helicase family protein [Erysipelotrichaceae bacterium]